MSTASQPQPSTQPALPLSAAPTSRIGPSSASRSSALESAFVALASASEPPTSPPPDEPPLALVPCDALPNSPSSPADPDPHATIASTNDVPTRRIERC